MNQDLIFDITGLNNKAIGTSEKYSFQADAKMDDLNLKSDISGQLEVMVSEKGFNAVVTDLKLKVALKCPRCLNESIHQIAVPHVERTFYVHRPQVIDDPNDAFLVDRETQTIDLTEMLRQEIILHFPADSVCSKSCRGLCPTCGKDLNKENCDCKPRIEEPEGNFPLAKLKDLMK